MSLEEEARFYIKKLISSLQDTMKSLESEINKSELVLSKIEKNGLVEARTELSPPDSLEISCGNCGHKLDGNRTLLEYYVVRYSVPIYEDEERKHVWIAKIIECPKCKWLNLLLETSASLSHLGWDTPEDEVFIK